jgi:hypothetical protein
MPAVANYLRKPGHAYYRPFMIDVLRIESGSIAAGPVARRKLDALDYGTRLDDLRAPPGTGSKH